MNPYAIPNPTPRGALRLWAGRHWYTLKRYWQWQFAGIPFARQQAQAQLPISVFSHQSVLMRQLKDVDMWLQRNKVTNLRLAIEHINRVVIQPGEVFSFWYLVGNPTRQRGFQVGMTLSNGQVKPGYGGGLCQLTNLLYWMVLHSPLSVRERWRHSYDVFPDVGRTLPFGSGATVAYNYIDLQVENTTRHPYQFCLWLTETHLRGEIRSTVERPYDYEVLEREHLITGPVAGKYMRHNQIFRQLLSRETQAMVREEFVTENNALMMYAPLLEPAQ